MTSRAQQNAAIQWKTKVYCKQNQSPKHCDVMWQDSLDITATDDRELRTSTESTGDEA